MLEPFMAVGRLWFAEGVAQDLETVAFESAEAFQAWLGENHAVSPGIWLKLRKKAHGVVALDYVQALDVALCYGWIDGQRRSRDDVSFLQRYSRRRARSSWSQVNVAKVAALMEAGRMRPAGLAEIEAAKADGRWDAAYEPQRTAEIPPDLAAALAADPRAAAAFERLGRSERYAIILPLLKARSPESRATMIARAVGRLAQ